jgi:hypothetical protein
MKYYLIAGEASGDLHGSNLIAGIRKYDAKAEFRAWGGDLMQKEGALIVKHYRELAFMGFAEVVANLRTIASNIRYCKKDIVEWKPDVVIFIDYPGFNLRIVPFVKQQQIQTSLIANKSKSQIFHPEEQEETLPSYANNLSNKNLSKSSGHIPKLDEILPVLNESELRLETNSQVSQKIRQSLEMINNMSGNLNIKLKISLFFYECFFYFINIFYFPKCCYT